MKLVSLVPSLTETLVFCGADVVGRSRYCIHPAKGVQDIPIVGGTKQVDWDAVKALEPGLVILDKEENTREMAADCSFPYLALHVRNIDDIAGALDQLSELTGLATLRDVSRRWHAVAARPSPVRDLKDLPGVLEWWRPPSTQTRVEYLIWRDPWMAIGPETFIHSMLCKLGMGDLLHSYPEKYPKIDLGELDPDRTALLFSSEPFPFVKYREAMAELGFSCALIDGESYSWYGIRSLRFLEENL